MTASKTMAQFPGKDERVSLFRSPAETPIDNVLTVLAVVGCLFSGVVAIFLVLVLISSAASVLIRNLALGFSVAFFLSILAIGRWLAKNGALRTGIGCIGSTFLIAAGLTVPFLLPDASYRFGILGCGLVGWFACFCKLIPFMAEREGQQDAPQDRAIRSDGDDTA